MRGRGRASLTRQGRGDDAEQRLRCGAAPLFAAPPPGRPHFAEPGCAQLPGGAGRNSALHRGRKDILPLSRTSCPHSGRKRDYPGSEQSVATAQWLADGRAAGRPPVGHKSLAAGA